MAPAQPSLKDGEKKYFLDLFFPPSEDAVGPQIVVAETETSDLRTLLKTLSENTKLSRKLLIVELGKNFLRMSSENEVMLLQKSLITPSRVITQKKKKGAASRTEGKRVQC